MRRVALLGAVLEANAFAPTTTEADFRRLCYLEGDAMMVEARKPAPAMPKEIPGFVTAMDDAGPWTPVPIVVAAAEPGGPVDHDFFARLLAAMRRRLDAAGPLAAVYIVNHGAMTSTRSHEPHAEPYRLVPATRVP